jgi:hypothetical protein
VAVEVKAGLVTRLRVYGATGAVLLRDTDSASLDVTLDLEAASNRLVVVGSHLVSVSFGFRMNSSLDVGFDFEAARDCLVVVIATLLAANEGCSSLDTALDLQSTRRCLVVVHDTASLDAALDLQAASHCLVVVQANAASLDVRSDLEAARDCLAVIYTTARFDIRSDFHTYHYSIRILTLNIERLRHTLGFEAEVRRSLVQAGTRRGINHAAENIFARKKAGSRARLRFFRYCRLKYQGRGGQL